MTEFDASRLSDVPAFYGFYHWYVIHCKSGKEKSAAETLRSNLGLIVYLPEKKVWIKGNARYIPLFPSYFFIQADLIRTVPSQINASPGVLRLLAYDGIPQIVPSDFVETLYAEIARLNEYSSAPNQGFRPGDTLYVIDGPLRGLEAVFIGPTTPSKRVQVLLNFLGRLTKAEVEGSTLEKRTENIKLKQVRYTRGKGRKIRSKETT
jgi:transcription antitermination factor NusG